MTGFPTPQPWERVKLAVNVRIKFSRVLQRRHFADLLQAGWRYNANGCLQNALLLLHHKENAPWKHALYPHLFWNLFQMELYSPTNLPVATKVYVLSSVTDFSERAHISCNWVWNGLELSINTFAVLSLVYINWTELTSEIFCPNYFLHFAYQKCFFFS